MDLVEFVNTYARPYLMERGYRQRRLKFLKQGDVAVAIVQFKAHTKGSSTSFYIEWSVIPRSSLAFFRADNSKAVPAITWGIDCDSTLVPEDDRQFPNSYGARYHWWYSGSEESAGWERIQRFFDETAMPFLEKVMTYDGFIDVYGSRPVKVPAMLRAGRTYGDTPSGPYAAKLALDLYTAPREVVEPQVRFLNEGAAEDDKWAAFWRERLAAGPSELPSL